MPPMPSSSIISNCGNCAANWAGSGATRDSGADATSGFILMVVLGVAESVPRATLARQAGQRPSGAFSGKGCWHCWQIRIVSIFNLSSVFSPLTEENRAQGNSNLHLLGGDALE